MKLGAIEIYPVTDGRFRLDGGAMFGVVPKTLWERCCQADEQNRIPLSLTCLLIRAHGKNILVDTGLGDKEDAKFYQRFAVDRTPTLRESLQRYGLLPQDIHMVINTHLHFDHAGGNTVRASSGALIPAFPNAAYFVQQGEYDDAASANERTRVSYRRDNFTKLAQVNKWEFLTGDQELLPGISAVVTNGHTRCHQSVKIESEGRVAFFLGDLIPTVSHLPLPYIMGYDVEPLRTLESKKRILTTAAREGWRVVFEHDADMPLGVLQEQGGKLRAAPCVVEA
jgi:glyoxylase-like metal-dependent hydrolase (beta-lactamase superfamily II)